MYRFRLGNASKYRKTRELDMPEGTSCWTSSSSPFAPSSAEADNWVEIEEFGKAKEEWFRRFLKLPRDGIPSHDTFGRVFSLLDPEQFSACFMDWVRSVSELAYGEVVAIDGKTLRRCHDRANGRGPLHMVSAWATERRTVLGQTRTEAHSNEITAIPELLKVLELKGCLVTIDAMGCQKNIARQVVRGGRITCFR